MPSARTVKRIAAAAAQKPGRPSALWSEAKTREALGVGMSGDERERGDDERAVGEEGSVDAVDGAERRADEPAGGVGGEDAAHAEVLLAGPASERVEGDADPQAAGAEPHREPGREVGGQARAEDETQATERDDGEGEQDHGLGAEALRRGPGGREADHHPGGEGGDEEPDGRR